MLTNNGPRTKLGYGITKQKQKINTDTKIETKFRNKNNNRNNKNKIENRENRKHKKNEKQKDTAG